MENISKIKEKGKKIVMGAGIVAAGLNASPTFASENVENIPGDEKVITFEENNTSASSEETYVFNPAGLENVGDDEKEKEKGIESKENYEIDFAQYFEMGSAEIKESDKQAIEQKLRDFFQSLPEDVVQRLKDGESAISVYATCSPELIPSDYMTGEYKIRKSNPDNMSEGGNNDLGLARAHEMGESISNALDAEGISGVQIEFEVPQGGVDEDGKRKVRVSFNDTVFELSPDLMEKHEDVVTEKTFGVIFDYSGSMISRTNHLKEDIKIFNKEKGNNPEIKTFQLAGGNNEVHLLTLKSILMNEKNVNTTGETQRLYIVTDELDASLGVDFSDSISVEKYHKMMTEVLDLANQKDIEIVVNFYNPSASSMEYKEIVLSKENMDVLIPGRIKAQDRLEIYNSL